MKGRPKVLDEARETKVTLERQQLKKLDALAEDMGVSRSEVMRFAIDALDTPLIEMKKAYEEEIRALRESQNQTTSSMQTNLVIEEEISKVRSQYKRYLQKAEDVTSVEKLNWMRWRAKNLGMTPLALLRLVEQEESKKVAKAGMHEIIERGILPPQPKEQEETE